MPAYHARIAFEGHNATTNALIVNVLHVEADLLTSPPNWPSVANDIWTWLGAPWLAMLSTHCILDQIVVTDENYPGSTHGQAVATIDTAGTRTAADTNLDPALCAVTSLKTAVAKRYARGHIFNPPAETQSALAPNGLFLTTNAYWTACKAFADAFKAGHVAGSTSYVPEVFSKHEVALGAPTFGFPVTSATVGQKQHWLRSRSTAP